MHFLNLCVNKKLRCRTDDIFILGILRARKFNRERAYKLISNYYSSRRKYPTIFNNLNPSSLEKVLRLNIMQFLPKPDQHGRLIGVASGRHWNTDVANIVDVFRCAILFLDLYINYHRLQTNGLVVVVNAADISWKHIVQFTPNFIHVLITTLYDSYQMKYKEIHFINVNKYFKAVITLLLPLLPEKLRKRIHLYGSDIDSLHTYIDPKYLPEEFGGKLPNFDPTESNQILRNNEEYFRNCETYWR
ncbi:clavesin-1-like [Centruroides sculpturatus]|uniref:clavesin-1-like n=1 Tax=Centruroides sculpturatus TaxID=218467 RepID=UPI000C6CB61B|nr:clavesin-1-like [Centruroides sculpturatus]